MQNSKIDICSGEKYCIVAIPLCYSYLNPWSTLVQEISNLSVLYLPLTILGSYCFTITSKEPAIIYQAVTWKVFTSVGYSFCHQSETKLQTKADSVIKFLQRSYNSDFLSPLSIILATYITQIKQEESNLALLLKIKNTCILWHCISIRNLL